MDIAVKSLLLGLNPQIFSQKQTVHFHVRVPCSLKTCFSLRPRNDAYEIAARGNFRPSTQVFALSPGLERDVFSPPGLTVSGASEAREVKMRVDISGARTQAIFDDVFSKVVAEAQPIPGFRRVKGGKTPNIPKDVLLRILGPSKVYKRAIKKIINSAVAECVQKEGWAVTEDLKIEESYEELEAAFEPGKDFSFNAILQLQETQKK